MRWRRKTGQRRPNIAPLPTPSDTVPRPPPVDDLAVRLRSEIVHCRYMTRHERRHSGVSLMVSDRPPVRVTVARRASGDYR
jgi:hypothetical protein